MSSFTSRLGDVVLSPYFLDAPELSLSDSIIALMTGLKTAPPDRPDLERLIPKDEDVVQVLQNLNNVFESFKRTRDLAKEFPGMDENDCRVLLSYTMESPYPLYRWFNGWLQFQNKDDPLIVSNVGPYFTRLYRAMEKLPKITIRGSHFVSVGNNTLLRKTFDHYQESLAPGNILHFWSLCSFGTLRAQEQFFSIK
eukprot:PhF_6_TR44556/c0_g1_i1/m.68609